MSGGDITLSSRLHNSPSPRLAPVGDPRWHVGVFPYLPPTTDYLLSTYRLPPSTYHLPSSPWPCFRICIRTGYHDTDLLILRDILALLLARPSPIVFPDPVGGCRWQVACAGFSPPTAYRLPPTFLWLYPQSALDWNKLRFTILLILNHMSALFVVSIHISRK